MLCSFKKLNSKTLGLLTVLRTKYSSQNIKVVLNSKQNIETLYLTEKKYFEGSLSIINYLRQNPYCVEGYEKLFWVQNDIIEKQQKKDNSGFIKAVKNKTYKKLDKFLVKTHFLDGAQEGEIDILAYIKLRKYFQENDKTKRFPKLLAWFKKLKEKLEPEVTKILTEFGTQEAEKKPDSQAPKGKEKAEKAKEQKEKPKSKPENKQPEPKKKEEPKPKKEKADDNLPPEYKKAFETAKIIRFNAGQKILPSNKKKNILITSALPYVNNVPHLGNIIGCVLSADVFARYCRLRGHNTIYICGTDEYGTATEIKALKDKTTPQKVCEKYSQLHNEIYNWFDCDFDYFGGTATDNQTKIAQDIFNNLYKNNHFTYDTVEQTYCSTCDLTLSDRFVAGTCPHCKFEDAKGDQCDKCGKLLNPEDLIDPKCQICLKAPIKRNSKHIYLNLPELQPELEKWIDSASQDGFWSDNSRNITSNWIKTGLKPRCISRDLKWGTPVPLEEFKSKVFYVWFDAPIGYISITANYTEGWEQWWKNPENVKLYQFMGKDNVPFHTVIFPSSLIGTGEKWTLLHHISTTEYLNYEDCKFSKSRGTGVFGDDAAKINIPSEIWRYYLLINRPEKSDSVFLWSDFGAKINNELLSNVGNLCNRVLKLIYAKYEKKIPVLDKSKLTNDDHAFLKKVYGFLGNYVEAFEKVEIKDALKIAMETSHETNKYIQDNEPWEKKHFESKRSEVVLAVIANVIRFVSCLFEPFMPSLSAKINLILALDKRTERDDLLLEYLVEARSPDVLLTLVPSGHQINQPVVLITPVPESQLQEWKARFGGKKD